VNRVRFDLNENFVQYSIISPFLVEALWKKISAPLLIEGFPMVPRMWQVVS
jgi:hypothetical protein